jgi:glycosyltransferase involved in cell wall biosynthesis
VKKVLFISNMSEKITNFSIPLIEAAQSLGYEFHMAANFSKFDDDASKYNVFIHHIDIERNPFNPKNLRAYRQTLNLIRKEKIEVIHCNTPIGGVLGRLCGTRAKVPVIIYTAHGFHFYEGAPLINLTVLKWAEYFMARMTDVIITITKEDYKAAQRMKLRKDGQVFYVPGVGIDIDTIEDTKVDRRAKRSELGIREKDFVVIAVGRLERNKNVENMIRATAETDDNVRLLLCGEGEQRRYLEALAEDLGIAHRVVFAGFRNDVPQLLKISDAYLLISYREGLSRSLMEAMAAGLPCVVSDIRGNVDLIDHGLGGYLLSPNNVVEIAKAINSLVNDTQLCERMGRINREKVQSFSIEVVKTRMKEIYKLLLLEN